MEILERLGPIVQVFILLGIVGSLASFLTLYLGITDWTTVTWFAQEEPLTSLGAFFYTHDSLVIFNVGIVIASILLSLGTLGYSIRQQSIMGLISSIFFAISLYYSLVFFNSLLTWVHPEQILEYRDWRTFRQIMLGATGTYYMSFSLFGIPISLKNETRRYGSLIILFSLIGIVIMGTDIRLTHLSTFVMPIVYIISMLVFNVLRRLQIEED